MVFIRRAYDKLLTQAITTRARDSKTPLTVQRNIDEAFRAINGLRVLAGASPSAIARALSFQRALNQTTLRFTLGVDVSPPSKVTPVTKKNEQLVLLQDVTGLHNGSSSSPSGSQSHVSQLLAFPYTWSFLSVFCYCNTQPIAKSGTARVQINLGGYHANNRDTGGSLIFGHPAGVPGAAFFDGRSGGIRINQAQIEFQGKRREVAPDYAAFIRVFVDGPIDFDTQWHFEVEALVDAQVGVGG